MSNATLIINNPSAYLREGKYTFAQNQDYLTAVKTGFGEAAKSLNNAFSYAVGHYFSPVSRVTLEQKFDMLALTWKIDTRHESSALKISQHPSYQQIIGMGKDVLPCIFAEMNRKPGHWFMALQAITGINPVKSEHRGDVAAMTNDWVDWGIKRGFINK